MREFLFRGKTITDNKWVYGYYASDKNGHYILVSHDNGIKQHTVYENSVGQWTGKCDKNGIKMFEGDVVDIDSLGCYKIDYDSTLAVFLFIYIDNSTKQYLADFSTTKTKVIDNIFDMKYREQTTVTDDIENKVKKIKQIENALNIKFTAEQIKFLLFGVSRKDMEHWGRGTGKTLCSFVKSIIEIPKGAYICHSSSTNSFLCYYNDEVYQQTPKTIYFNFCYYDIDVSYYETYSSTRRNINACIHEWIKKLQKHGIIEYYYS